jgi:hypothetical protein
MLSEAIKGDLSRYHIGSPDRSALEAGYNISNGKS